MNSNDSAESSIHSVDSEEEEATATPTTPPVPVTPPPAQVVDPDDEQLARFERLMEAAFREQELEEGSHEVYTLGPGDVKDNNTNDLFRWAQDNKIGTYGASNHPRGELQLMPGMFRATGAIAVDQRVCLTGLSKHTRQFGARIVGHKVLVPGERILVVERSDERKVARFRKNYEKALEKWRKQGSDPKKRPKKPQLTANYNGNFDQSMENIAFDMQVREAGASHRFDGPIWGFAQTSLVQGCEFRYALKTGLTIGNGSTRGHLQELTFAWNPVALEFNRINCITGSTFSLLRGPVGICGHHVDGLNLTGISTEHITTPLVLEEHCVDVNISGLTIALADTYATDKPVFDFSKMPDHKTYKGIVIKGTYRKGKKGKTPFYIDPFGRKQELMGRVMVDQDGNVMHPSEQTAVVLEDGKVKERGKQGRWVNSSLGRTDGLLAKSFKLEF